MVSWYRSCPVHSLAVATTGSSSLGKDLAQWCWWLQMSMLLPLTPDPSCHYFIMLSLGAGKGETSCHFWLRVTCYLHFHYLPALALWLSPKQYAPSCLEVSGPICPFDITYFYHISSTSFLHSSLSDHVISGLTLCLFPETQPCCSSELDLLIWFATFHVYFCCNDFSQFCCFHMHCNTGTSQLATTDPKTVTPFFWILLLFFTLKIVLVFS